MSILVEISGAIGGILSEYAFQNGWSIKKFFSVIFIVVFIPWSVYFLFFPTARGVLEGVLAAAFLGISLGSIGALLLYFRVKKHKKTNN